MSALSYTEIGAAMLCAVTSGAVLGLAGFFGVLALIDWVAR